MIKKTLLTILLCVLTAPLALRADDSLLTLIQAGDVSKVKALLKSQGAKALDERTEVGATPLHQAAWQDQFEIAKLLIDNGADLNATTTEKLATPLHWAAHKNADTIARLLLMKGANVDARSHSGYTPLHWAAIGDSVKAAKELEKRDADLNARANDGATPLHLAISMNTLGMIENLLNDAGILSSFLCLS